MEESLENKIKKAQELREERIKQAMLKNISHQAAIIAEYLGKPFSEFHHGGGGGLSGDGYSISMNGFRFKNKDIEITSEKDTWDSDENYLETYINFPAISKFLFFKIKDFEEVYHQQERLDKGKEETKIETYKNEEKWLPVLYNLYAKAVSAKTRENEEELIAKRKEDLNRIIGYSDDFGIANKI